MKHLKRIMRNVMSWIKSYLPSIVISVLIILIMELGFRYLINYPPLHERGRGRYTDDVISAIYGSENVEDYKTVLIEQYRDLDYHPFVEYKEAPRSGKFVSVSQQNIR